jgi:hypothetical protein
MELSRRKNAPPVVLDGWLTDLGSVLGRSLRGSVDIAGRAVNVITTRGGADELTYIGGAPEPSVNPMVWYALGAVGVVAVAVTMKKRRKGGRR